ncbi:hypothetical protein L6164_009033 [Bauhinia variegata]|uniref:Uncharacterized protein n=1 Tax=Bauhinia variegata TaxID=167791 RepID=A0ACB9PHM9_BAUVA|nr:hypothetical protein L6164_009033 [Bauhinia variegata]
MLERNMNIHRSDSRSLITDLQLNWSCLLIKIVLFHYVHLRRVICQLVVKFAQENFFSISSRVRTVITLFTVSNNYFPAGPTPTNPIPKYDSIYTVTGGTRIVT